MGHRYPCSATHHDKLEEFVTSHLRPEGSTLIVGVQGVQGCGKTHACKVLCDRLQASGHAATCVSLDDFYLPRRTMGMDTIRGPPGTHALDELSSTLAAVREGATSIRLPAYDKSLLDGLGDRASGTRLVTLTPDRPSVFVVEGWCLGFEPDCDGSLASDGAVDEVQVQRYHLALRGLFDVFVVLECDYRHAYEWREREERARREEGLGALDTEGVKRLVDVYMPYYERYSATVAKSMDAVLRVSLDEEVR